MAANAGSTANSSICQPKPCSSAPALKLAAADMPKTLKSFAAWARKRSSVR